MPNKRYNFPGSYANGTGGQDTAIKTAGSSGAVIISLSSMSINMTNLGSFCSAYLSTIEEQTKSLVAEEKKQVIESVSKSMQNVQHALSVLPQLVGRRAEELGSIIGDGKLLLSLMDLDFQNIWGDFSHVFQVFMGLLRSEKKAESQKMALSFVIGIFSPDVMHEAFSMSGKYFAKVVSLAAAEGTLAMEAVETSLNKVQEVVAPKTAGADWRSRLHGS